MSMAQRAPEKTDRGGGNRFSRDTSSESLYGRAALADELDQLEHTPQGTRHGRLYQAARALGELVAGDELDHTHVEDELVEMGRIIGLAEGDARRQVRRGMKDGRANPRRANNAPSPSITDRIEARELVLRWWQTVEHDEHYRGRTGTTTLRILAGFAVCAFAAGKTTINESYRELAEASGVSIGTITKHRAAWMRHVRQVRAGNAWTGARSEWQLRISQTRAIGNMPEASPTGCAGVFPNARTLADPADPHWHRWTNGWAVYRLLDHRDGRTAVELAQLIGLHPGSVRRILNRLAADGIAERDGDGYWSAIEEGVYEPEYDGIVNPRAERKARHVADRLAWDRRRAQLRTERARERYADPATGEILRPEERDTA